MSRAAIGAVLGALIAVITGAAYMMTTSSLEGGIRDDVEQRVAKAQELLIQNSSLEMLRLLKHAEALALDPKLVDSLGGGSEEAESGPDPLIAEAVFKKFRAGLSPDEAQPDIMAITDDRGKLIALMSGPNPVPDPVPDTYLSAGKIKYPALDASVANQIVTSEIWDYEGSGAMKVTVAPVLDPETGSTLGTVLVAYAITQPEARKQEALLGARVVYFYDKGIHTSSFGSAKEQQSSLGKMLFDGGLAEQALKAKSGLGDIRAVTHGGNDYLATTGRLPRYFSKRVGDNYPSPKAGAMVLISLTDASKSVGTAGITILLVGFMGIVLVLLGINLAARRILHPLEEIEIGVNDIINGNLDRTFEPVGTDLDGLANALNVMLARILGRPEPGEEEFDEDGNIIQSHAQLPHLQQSGPVDQKQADAEALASEPMEVYLRRVHGEFVAAKQASGEDSSVEYDGFVQKLMANEASLKQKYGAREVRFKVVTDAGKVTLKPVPIV
ncbi:MAG: hypothetical protein GY811_05175 [Myxococcales bacterium]|nr:hypothetical protein [Myxococcales bacterium]